MFNFALDANGGIVSNFQPAPFDFSRLANLPVFYSEANFNYERLVTTTVENATMWARMIHAQGSTLSFIASSAASSPALARAGISRACCCMSHRPIRARLFKSPNEFPSSCFLREKSSPDELDTKAGKWQVGRSVDRSFPRHWPDPRSPLNPRIKRFRVLS
jgi:hypothetical protein